jgi:hypothetical protein
MSSKRIWGIAVLVVIWRDGGDHAAGAARLLVLLGTMALAAISSRE